jgi:hypothetical protein
MKDGFGYFLEMATRPQTISYAQLDSPVALAAWLLDHDTDSYYKISRAFVDGQPAGNLTRDHILDNITLYWLTGTAPRRPAPTACGSRGGLLDAPVGAREERPDAERHAVPAAVGPSSG